jgi:hypothetical protein
MCACGKPLHYESKATQAMVEKLIVDLGEEIRVVFGNRTWLVPRHYVALHGIDYEQVLMRGFNEITDIPPENKTPGADCGNF